MITSVRMVNFKNFADETLKVGPFTIIVGANASGKSNIRDAFRFLHGIGRGYTLAEILGGKYGPGRQPGVGGHTGGTGGGCAVCVVTSRKSAYIFSLRRIGNVMGQSILFDFRRVQLGGIRRISCAA